MRSSHGMPAAIAAAALLVIATTGAAAARLSKPTLPKLDCADDCPRVLVMVTERTDAPLSPPWWAKKDGCRQALNASEASLAADLAAIGYRVINRRTLPGGGAGLCWIESATPGSKELSRFAASLSAEFVVYGEVVSADPCTNMMGTSMLHCQAAVSLRAILAANATVLATTTIGAPGSHLNPVAARSVAIRNAVRRATIDLGEKLSKRGTQHAPTAATMTAKPARRSSGGKSEKLKVTATGTDRDAAIQSALRQAIDEGAKVYVSEKTGSRLAAWFDGELREKATGFVESYQVIREEKKEDGYEVEIGAKVKTTALREAINAKLIELCGDDLPKVLVMIREHGIEPPREPWWANTQCAGSALDVAENVVMESLVSGGLHVVDRRVLQNKAAASCPLAGASPSDEEIRTFGPGLGADVVILGDAAGELQESSMMGTRMKNAQARITLRALRALDGEVLGTVTVQAAGGHLNQNSAIQRALQSASTQAAEQLLTLLLDRWQQP